MLRSQSISKADSLLDAQNYKQAIIEYASVIEANKTAKSISLGNAYLRKGKCYFFLSKIDSSLTDYYNALKTFESFNNIERLAAATSNIASAYFSINDFQNADKFYSRSYDYSKDIKDSTGIASILNDWAIMLNLKGETRKAIGFHKQAIQDFKKVITQEDLANNYLNLGICYMSIGTDSALYFFKLAEQSAGNDTKTLAFIFNNIGVLYKENARYKDALRYFNKSWEINNDQNDPQLFSFLSNNISEMYDTLKMYDSATFFLKKALQYNNILFDQQKSRFASELSEKYESDKKDEKIRSQETENKLKSRNLLLSLGGLALAAALAIVSFISYQRKQKANRQLIAQNEHIEKLNKELDASNQVKTKLFSVISHDLRSPISSLYAHLQLKNNAPDKKDIAFIQQTEQLLETLEDLLVWSKSQLHQFVIYPQNIYLYEICNDVCSLLYADALQKDNRIINNIAPALAIRSDVNMLTIVLRNILSNAIKYSLPGSAIEVNAKIARELATITVANEAGSENIHLLYSLQDDTVTSEKSGLGLTLVKEFIAKLNGQFTCTTEHNKTIAVITLPLPGPTIIQAGA
ncbi:MAG: tetratricopeptide repeat-containing sensor histidine kinase [Chitinophagaceae bacterium]|nr:tetratricopeptide repeat-containing sensor histidine kinase [Chitinophagaceae bacterium]